MKIAASASPRGPACYRAGVAGNPRCWAFVLGNTHALVIAPPVASGLAQADGFAGDENWNHLPYEEFG